MAFKLGYWCISVNDRNVIFTLFFCIIINALQSITRLYKSTAKGSFEREK